MAIKELTILKVPSARDTVHTFPEISSWYRQCSSNLVSGAGEDIKVLRKELICEALKFSNRLFGESVNYADFDSPVIGTGHQPVWHHCGILAKDIVSEAFCRSLDATNMHIILDHDIQELFIRLPLSEQAGYIRRKFKIKREKPFEFKKFSAGIIDVSKFPGSAFCKRWTKEMIVNASNKSNMSDAVTYLQGYLKAQFGIKPIYLPVSRICRTKAFALFLRKILNNPEKFSAVYNNAIKTISKDNSYISRNFKLLEIQNNRSLGLPFWLLSSSGKRKNFQIITKKHNQCIYADNINLCRLDSGKIMLKKIRDQGYDVRPKAITLMLFLRLYLFDWFIHGIGGGKYELITDYILENFYNIENSSYGIASLTSTLLEDNTLISKTNKQIGYLKSLSRQLLYSPEKFYYSNDPPRHFIQLSQNKITAVKTIKKQDITRAHRDLLFKEIAKINSKLLAYVSEEYRDVLARLDEKCIEKSRLEKADRRDYFFGLFPETRLRTIIRKTLEDECFANAKTQKNSSSCSTS